MQLNEKYAILFIYEKNEIKTRVHIIFCCLFLKKKGLTLKTLTI